MAVSTDLPGLAISIQVNGQPLPEYRDDDIQDPERTTSYMIEAVSDRIFEIHARANSQATFAGSSLAIQFYVDGKYVDGTLVDASDVRANGSSARSQGRYVSSTMLRKYQFASREQQIEIVESKSSSLSSRLRTSGRSSETPMVSYTGYTSRSIQEPTSAPFSQESSFDIATPPSYTPSAASNAPSTGDSLGILSASGSSFPSLNTPTPPTATPATNANTTTGTDTNNLEELGTIKVVVCHVNKKQPVVFGKSSSATSKISDSAQKAIKDKAGGLLVRFTAPQQVSPVTTWDVDAANDDEDSSVTYIYHYRTHEMLDALGVLPKEARILPLPLRAKKLEAVEEDAQTEELAEHTDDGTTDQGVVGGARTGDLVRRNAMQSGSAGVVSADGEDWDVVDAEEIAESGGRGY